MATFRTIYRQRSDDGFLFIQYGHDAKSVLFTTNIKVGPESINFIKDKRGNEIPDPDNPLRRNVQGYSVKNANIRKLKQEIGNIVDRLINQKINPSIKLVKEEYQKLVDKQTGNDKPKTSNQHDIKILLKSFLESPITKGKKKGKIRAKSSSRQFYSAINNLQRYLKSRKRPFQFSSIDANFYDRYSNYLRDELKESDNTIGNQFKNLKTFFNWVQDRGYYTFEFPFSSWTAIKRQKDITFLRSDEVEKIFLSKQSGRLAKVRAILLAGCQTGLRYSDLRLFNPTMIEGGTHIRTRAHKTDTAVLIPITPMMRTVLQEYDWDLPKMPEQKFNKYVKKLLYQLKINRPVRLRITENDYYKEISQYRGGKEVKRKFGLNYQYRELLKEFNPDAEIKDLPKYFNNATDTDFYTSVPFWLVASSHLSVRTYITLAHQNGMGIKTISKITGKSEKVILEVYLGSDQESIDHDFNKSSFGNLPNMMVS